MNGITLNRLANTKNRFQTPAKRVLCLCSAGLLRSPTTANVLHSEFSHNTRAAGVSAEYALIPVCPVLIEWADEIVCVEQSVKDTLFAEWGDLLRHKAVVVLAVPDMYEWDHPTLRKMILDQYKTATAGQPHV